MRVATVTRGDLVRDLSADGRVIAADTPAVYAIVGGPAALKVVAGNVVKQGPIASPAHSGAGMLRCGRSERLEQVFATIREHARRLEGFIRGDARFAKLPQPVLQNTQWAAPVPFYFTKRNGTGPGLVLTREIVEAHGGRLSLHNREGGGLCGAIQLPD